MSPTAVASQSPLLEAKGITVFRGDEPLFADIDVTLLRGQLLQIEGSNGSGKTTLLRILCGLALADEGEILWYGKKLSRQRAAFFSQMLYLGHKAAIKPELTAIENLAFYQRLSLSTEPDSHDNDQSNLQTALRSVNLAAQAQLPCAVLSAGQQRRVALARLLLTPASLWILDEPLTALDVDGRETVQRVLSDHVTRGGSLIYTTHQAFPFAELPSISLSLDA